MERTYLSIHLYTVHNETGTSVESVRGQEVRYYAVSVCQLTTVSVLNRAVGISKNNLVHAL